jgi:zinc transporter, ZIP family
MRTGLFTAMAIAIHNFPEGIGIFATSLSDIKLGVMIAIAVAIHNIPEGIAVSVPIFYATGNRNKAFLYSFLSGLSEPIGAILAFLILMPFLSEVFVASLLASVAGIMVYISVDEIIPTAHRAGRAHAVILGLVLGMFIMAISLLII